MILALLLLAGAPAGAPHGLAGAPQGSAAEPIPASSPLRPDEIAARGAGTLLSFDELDAVLLLRHARSEAGRSSLQHLLEAGLLSVLAAENGLEVTPAQVRERWDQLDSEVRASGQARGLDEYLARTGVDPAEFREHLRLSIVHETLARRGLGIPDSRAITGDQLQNWLNEQLLQRDVKSEPAPWKDGVVARCAGLVVTLDELLARLRQDLPAEDLGTLCYQALLAKRIAERMPDVSEELRAQAVADEIERRRFETESDPTYGGVPFAQILEAQGLDPAKLHLDPAIRVAAWAHLWVDRKYDEDALRAEYDAERERFDELFGEAVETWVIYLRAAELENELNPRDFEEALHEAGVLKETIRSLPQFQYEVRRTSEDRTTRDAGGFWGWITSGSPQVDPAVREAIFDALRSGDYDPSAPADAAERRLVGPIRGTTGVLLLWLGDRRPAPTWTEMRNHVHRELRRRFLEDVLPRDAVRTWRDE